MAEQTKQGFFAKYKKPLIIFVVVAIVAVIFYMMFFRSSVSNWKAEALKITGAAYNESSLNWNEIASRVNVLFCGGGAGDAPTACLADKQDKVIGLFKLVGVQPTAALIDKHKATIQAYLDSGEAIAHYNATLNEYKSATA